MRWSAARATVVGVTIPYRRMGLLEGAKPLRPPEDAAKVDHLTDEQREFLRSRRSS
jgi:hypothetical protein